MGASPCRADSTCRGLSPVALILNHVKRHILLPRALHDVVAGALPSAKIGPVQTCPVTLFTMAKKLVIALLLSVMLTLGVSNSKTTMQVVNWDPNAIPSASEDNVKAIATSTGPGSDQVQATLFGLFPFFGWGPPYPWWPDRFCSWDYWTSAAWQITLVGNFARCSSATGKALAGLASRTVSNDRKIQALLKGVIWKPLIAAPVLCAQTKTGQVTYTVRMQAPGPAVARVRTSSGNKLMQTSVFTATSVKSLKLSGKAAVLVRCCRSGKGRRAGMHNMMGLDAAAAASQCCQ